MRGSIYLSNSKTGSLSNFDTVGAFQARLRGWALFAVEAFGNDSCNGRLANSPRSRKEESVSYLVSLYTVGEGTGDMLLARNGREVLRSILSRKDKIRHRMIFTLPRGTGKSFKKRPEDASQKGSAAAAPFRT